MAHFSPLDHIVARIDFHETDSSDGVYDAMDSQSSRSLPVIYQPFDGRKGDHFADRGLILDYATVIEGSRVLDFGPGDGWPSLMLAPFFDEIVGVDASSKRVETCRANAERLGAKNATFVHVPTGESLPFPDESFDGITAGSSIEQTPDVAATMRELHRVLRPGGKMRVHYENLGGYVGRERQIWPGDHPDGAFLLIYDRDIKGRVARHYSLRLSISRNEVEVIFRRNGQKVSYGGMIEPVVEELMSHVTGGETWTLHHPTCREFIELMRETGFRDVTPTYDGGWFARRYFECLPESERPADMASVDRLLRPQVQVVVGMQAPCGHHPAEWEPWITAVR